MENQEILVRTLPLNLFTATKLSLDLGTVSILGIGTIRKIDNLFLRACWMGGSNLAQSACSSMDPSGKNGKGIKGAKTNATNERTNEPHVSGIKPKEEGESRVYPDTHLKLLHT